MRDAFRGRRSAEKESSPGVHIGEILMSWGKLSEEQLRAGLEAKRTDPRRIGEILLSLGFVSEEDLARAVAEAGGSSTWRSPRIRWTRRRYRSWARRRCASMRRSL